MSSFLKGILFFLLYISGFHLLIKKSRKKRVLILMYHGLTERETSLEWTQLPAGMFEGQMRYIAKNLNPVTMDDAVAYLAGEKSIPDNPVVVTFDDGYLSNFEIGAKILSKYHLTATVFAATSLIGDADAAGQTLWFDRVYESINSLPAGSYDFSDMGLGRYEIISGEDREFTSSRICEKMKLLDPAARSEIERRLTAAGKGADSSEIDHRGASWSDIRKSLSVFTFGAHTVSHQILSTLSEQAARGEICESRKTIEEKIGIPVNYFAYPNGRITDFTEANVEMVAESGYRAAVTTIEGFNDPGDDLYRLKRLGVGSDMGMIWFKLAVTGTIDYIRKFAG